MKRVVLYARTSSLANVEGDSLERQKATAKQFALASTAYVQDVFYDGGVSGTKPIVERKAINEMIAFAKANEIDTIYVASQDRWSRDLIVGELGFSQMAALGFQIVDCSRGVVLTDDSAVDYTGRMVRQLLGSIAEANRHQIVSTLRQARDRKSDQDGKRIEGQKGYAETHPELVREAKRLRRKNPVTKKVRSYRKVADMLYQMGWTTKTGNKFCAKQVKLLCSV